MPTRDLELTSFDTSTSSGRSAIVSEERFSSRGHYTPRDCKATRRTGGTGGNGRSRRKRDGRRSRPLLRSPNPFSSHNAFSGDNRTQADSDDEQYDEENDQDGNEEGDALEVRRFDITQLEQELRQELDVNGLREMQPLEVAYNPWTPGGRAELLSPQLGILISNESVSKSVSESFTSESFTSESFRYKADTDECHNELCVV